MLPAARPGWDTPTSNVIRDKGLAMQSNAELLRTLKPLEIELHQAETRREPARLEELLHPDFEEFGRSGRTYSRSEVVAEFADCSDFPDIQAGDFSATAIGERAALLTYVSAHCAHSGERHRHTLRSSLWLLCDGHWQLRFHQGTPTEGASEPKSER